MQQLFGTREGQIGAKVSERLKERVREHYASVARQVTAAGPDCGCEPACCAPSSAAAATSVSHDRWAETDAEARDCTFGPAGYRPDQLESLPAGAVAASLGCGNPTALIDLRPGETVLDPGPGGGIDVLLSARRVGPTGRAIGLDMTGEMLALARANALAAGVTNVEFLQGEMEDLPLPDASVDVVISNCVVNLSPDKDAVLREAFRVLRPRGRFASSDAIAHGSAIPPEVAADLSNWTSCIAGALEAGRYEEKLRAAGFIATEIEVTRVFGRDGVVVTVEAPTASALHSPRDEDWQLASAFIRAKKPV